MGVPEEGPALPAYIAATLYSMAPQKTSGNQQKTSSDETDVTGARLDHIDTVLHDLLQRVTAIQGFIDEHRPALARGLSLMDPGAAVRSALHLPARKERHG